MLLRNTSPYGDLSIPLVRRVVQGGTTFEVTREQATLLLPQRENYAPADDAARAVARDLGLLPKPAKKTANPKGDVQ